MRRRTADSSGFTLLEVTFATGITLLSFGLVLGSLFSLHHVRELNATRLQMIARLNDQVERFSAMPLNQAEAEIAASAEALADTDFQREGNSLRITVSATSGRGHPLHATATVALGAPQ